MPKKKKFNHKRAFDFTCLVLIGFAVVVAVLCADAYFMCLHPYAGSLLFILEFAALVYLVEGSR